MTIHLGRLNTLLRWLAPFGLSLAALGTLPAADADLIYVGRVITMTGTETDPRGRAEAVAIAGGRIVAVGSRTDVLKHRGKHTRLIELGDKAVLPGFIDAHGHLTATSSTLSLADLSAPPVGAVRSITDLQNALRRFIVERQLPADALVIGFGYDDAQLKEKRHPNRD
ncbi:MAG: amidohydrolase family protein, partial [Gammaproteobacteria bacterium]|nr:amidohydrolase family protein [Gammaproteobacteria bacterium]